MTAILHKAETRGAADFGWLTTRYSFSFSGWYHPEKIQFGALRVLNDDIVAGGSGFGMHPHDNMEIITIPLSGQLKHTDDLGNNGSISKGEVQVMSAGTGVRHSEFNPDAHNPVSLLQIWIFPEKKNVAPRYDQRRFDFDSVKNAFITLVSPIDTTEDSLQIHQQAWISYGKLDAGQSLTYELKKKDNAVYVFMVDGYAVVQNTALHTRDAAGISHAASLPVQAMQHSEVLLIEVPLQW